MTWKAFWQKSFHRLRLWMRQVSWALQELGQHIFLVLLNIIRLVLYIPRLIIRLFFYCMLLVLMAYNVIFIVLLGLGLGVSLSEILNERIALIGFVFSIGLIPSLVTILGKQALIELGELISDIREQIGEWEWPPSWEIFPDEERSFSYSKEFSNAFKSRKSGLKLIFFTALITALIVLTNAYFNSKEGPGEKYHVVVVGGDNPKAKEAEIKGYFLKEGTVFSLTHLNNANKEGEGVCLNEYHQHWLTAFRKAVSECVEEQRKENPEFKLEMQVTGFASSATSESGSSEVNCEFANMRADAVASYLARRSENANFLQKWCCGNVNQECDFENLEELCVEGTRPKFYETDEFKIVVRQWQDAHKMVEGKPAHDGFQFDKLTFKSELLNRSVHISIPEKFCRIAANADSPAEEENHAN